MHATAGDADQSLELEKIDSEDDDLESSPASYEILTYPADYTLVGLVKKWRDLEITIPKFQRQFVWTPKQSSKLIESFLLGLPVPPIFLYVQPDNTFLVVDGQQRLRTVAYFFEGLLEEVKGKRPVFRLTGLHDKSPYLNKTYADIADSDEVSHRRLNDAVLRSFVVKQLRPRDDDTSIYHIFERLNTGGALLRGQEIRNCIYYGSLNDTLHELNKLEQWRMILGRPNEDKRKRDLELILRCFALLYEGASYEKPMKEFLNVFMAKHRNASAAEIKTYKQTFTKTVASVFEHLGPKPFHVRNGLNIAVYDSVFPAFASHLGKVPADVKARYDRLKADETYINHTTFRTTDNEIVKKRLEKANTILFRG